MIIELSTCGYVYPIGDDGKSLTGKAFEALKDCTGSGDCEYACQFVLDHYKPEFTIIKLIDRDYQNVNASADDKRKLCESIYFESEADFADENNADLYLIWEAAHQLIQQKENEQ